MYEGKQKALDLIRELRIAEEPMLVMAIHTQKGWESEREGRVQQIYDRQTG